MIVKSTISANGYTGALQADLLQLAEQIAGAHKLVPLEAPELRPWNEHPPMAAALAAGETWLSAPWFLVETYLYKRILELTNHRHAQTTGARCAGSSLPHDPFKAQKEEALHASERTLVDSILPLFGSAAGLAHAPLSHFVYRALWGNRADLSISAGNGQQAVSAAQDAERFDALRRGLAQAAGPGAEGGRCVPLAEVQDSGHLLCDHTAALLAALPPAPAQAGAKPTGTVLIVLDNAGLELLTDLALAVALVRLGHCAVVELLAKDSPTFVSDAMPADVHETLSWLRQHAQPEARALAAELDELYASGRLVVSGGDEPFFTSPLPFWQLPQRLADKMAAAEAVLLKGDANYRRLLGDAHWPHDTPPSAVLGTGWPAVRTFCLRTCKSEVLVGVPADRTASAASESAAWITAGQFGVVQQF